MAVQRLTLAQIETNILEIMGYESSLLAPWKTSANLYLRINDYGQRLAMRLNSMARQLQMPTPVRFDMWRTRADSGTSTTTGCQVTAGSATVYLPVNYDHWISFYNISDQKPIYPMLNAQRWDVEDLVNSPPGMPRYIDIGGYITQGSYWRRTATLYPAPITGYTPSIRLEFWRLPATMTSASDYPDIDPKYEFLFVAGTVCDLARSTGQEFDRYSALEKELLVEMLSTARAI